MKFYQRFLPYGIAIGSTTIALLLTLWLEPFLLRTIGAFFYIAIIVTAWYGGFRSGSVTVFLATLAINYFFIPPQYQFEIGQPEDVFQYTIFFLVALTINLLTSSFRDSKHKIERLRQKLAQENTELLRIAPSAAQMGMWNWDIAKGQMQWSLDHELLFGLTPGTFDGKYETFEACLHPDDKESVKQAIQQAIQNNSLYQLEYRVVWADGSIHWIEARGHAFYNEAGEPIQMTGTVTAIDERKQAQGLLQQQIEQQRLVMQITQRIRQSLNLQDMLQTTVDEVRQFLQCDRASTRLRDRVIIYQFAPNWSGTVIVESVGAECTAILSTEIYDPCFAENYIEPFKQGLVTVKSDIYNAGINPCHLQLLENFQVRANLVVPIIKKDELWGLLIAHDCEASRQWQSSEIDLLQQLAAQVSIALQQSELFEQVQKELLERKQAETRLQEREAILRLFAQYAPVGIAMFDRDMCYLMASQRWADEYQIASVESLINRSHYEIFPEIPERWREIHQQCLAGAIEKCDEDLFVRKDGTEQWVWWEVHPWYTAKDEIGGIIIFSVDITARKQAEIALQQLNVELEQRVAQRTTEFSEVNTRLLETLTALKESEESRRLALDLTHIGFWDWHLPSGKIIWNDNHFTLIGLAPFSIEPSYELWRSYIHPDDIDWLEQRFLESIANHKDYAAEYRVVYPDNSVHWLMGRAKAIYDESGQAVRSIGVLLDISNRKRSEEELRQSEAKFRSLSDCSPAGIFMTDIQGHCIYTNPRYQAICDCTFEEALGEGWIQFLHPEDREKVTTSWSKAVSQKQEFADEIRYVHKDRTIRFCQVRSAPILSVSEELIGYVGAVEDVTESRAIEQMKSEFISIVSHELRTPLASIRGSLGLLAAGVFKNKPETAQQMLDIAANNTERLVRLVNDILDLERLEAQKVKLNKQWYDTAKIMQQSVETVQSLATESQIKLSVESVSVEIWVDGDRLIQTLVNLVSNAIKFSPPETTIRLSVQDQSDRVLFQVQDHGRGIPADKLDKIFGRFQQVDASDSRQKGGTGLGLAICKSIVQQHGGKIWAESVVGEGSSFYFTLPKLLD